MNASCCNSPSDSASSSCAPSVGVTESLRKPLYSVSSSPEALEVRVQVPGVPKSGVKMDLEENILTIQATRASNTPDAWKALHREISTQDYLLRLRVNSPVDEDKLSATLEDGVLTVRLPVKESAKPRRIAVN